MKKAVVIYDGKNKALIEELLRTLEHIWVNKGYECILLMTKDDRGFMPEVDRLNADILMTIAMAGFEHRNMGEGVCYNNLRAKQIHILIGNIPKYDVYLRKELGIHLFLFTDNEQIYTGWKQKYPLISFLEKIPMLYIGEHLTSVEKDRNEKNLEKMICRVFSFIKEPSVL